LESAKTLYGLQIIESDTVPSLKVGDIVIQRPSDDPITEEMAAKIITEAQKGSLLTLPKTFTMIEQNEVVSAMIESRKAMGDISDPENKNRTVVDWLEKLHGQLMNGVVGGGHFRKSLIDSAATILAMVEWTDYWTQTPPHHPPKKSDNGT
jgi:hypothetical protein